MEHLLLSSFGPMGVPRVEETARNISNEGFVYLVWFLRRCRRWFDWRSGCFISYFQCSFNRLSERGELCWCMRGTLWRKGRGYCFVQYSSGSFNPLFNGEGRSRLDR